MTVVLDASALLAYLKDEPGSDLVDGVLAESVMSSVNWAEVVQKSIAAGIEVDGLLDDLQVLGLRIEPFTSPRESVWFCSLGMELLPGAKQPSLQGNRQGYLRNATQKTTTNSKEKGRNSLVERNLFTVLTTVCFKSF